MTTRRDVLRWAALSPFLAHAALAKGTAPARTLVLVEFNGGNDGINTVVPFADPAYRRLRPRLALPVDDLWRLNDRLALHPKLGALKPAWDAGEVAIVNGVGYANPNRSHFRSIEIWNGATNSDQVADAGWLTRLQRGGPTLGGVVDGVVLGGAVGPLVGPRLRVIQMQSPGKFLRKSSALTDGAADASNPALAHVLGVRRGVQAAAARIRAQLQGVPQPTGFPKSKLGQQLAITARLLSAGLHVPVIKVSQSGYDTHANQLGKHARQLGDLAGSLAAFRAAMVAAGRWNDVLICTYAEFGRRPKENGSRGTDHGTAAPHFMLGGRVKGGLLGQQPSLTELAGGDLKHAVDYRRLYATASRFLGSPPPTSFGAPLPCLRG